jgi:hypothetical protein
MVESHVRLNQLALEKRHEASAGRILEGSYRVWNRFEASIAYSHYGVRTYFRRSTKVPKANPAMVSAIPDTATRRPHIRVRYP